MYENVIDALTNLDMDEKKKDTFMSLKEGDVVRIGENEFQFHISR